jgi:hypothetical protein
VFTLRDDTECDTYDMIRCCCCCSCVRRCFVTRAMVRPQLSLEQQEALQVTLLSTDVGHNKFHAT